MSYYIQRGLRDLNFSRLKEAQSFPDDFDGIVRFHRV